MTDNKVSGPLCHKKPDITYPCQWEYKVIGEDREKLTELLIAACAPAVPAISLSNVSSSGKYQSLNAVLQVDSEEMRLKIFDRLQQSPHVKMVI